MIEKIPQDELTEILHSYNLYGLSFDTAEQVEPDMIIYIFSDENNFKYVLLAADTLSGYEDNELPYDFEFDYGYPYNKVSFCAIKLFSHSEDAPKKATEYIDDKNIWAKASTGDVCMLFGCTNLKTN